MEKGVKQGKGSCPLLSMKKDQANKTNVEGVYRWQPLVWEPGPDRSGVNPQLVREWAQHSHMSCTSTHQSWSRVEAEEAEWRWRRWSGGRGSQRQLEAGGEGEGRSYHDTSNPIHILHQHTSSITCSLPQGMRMYMSSTIKLLTCSMHHQLKQESINLLILPSSGTVNQIRFLLSP